MFVVTFGSKQVGHTDGKLNTDGTVCVWNDELTVCQFVNAAKVFPVEM